MTAGPEARAPTRTAVIGVGYLGRFHAQKYAQLEQSRLVAVVDADAAAAAKVGAELGVPAVGDYREILGQVDAARCVERDWLIVEQRSRGEIAVFERELVQERLQRGAGLAPRAHAIDVSRPRNRTRGGNVREHVARDVVDDEHGTVAHVARSQLREMLAQHVARHLLQTGVERRAHALTRPVEQCTRELLR